MASLSKSKALFGFTSPRSVEKIIPEIDILCSNFEGRKWSGSEKTQIDFFNMLFSSEYYEGEEKPKDLALAARDRITRAPKAFGFVNLEPQINLTEAGKLLFNKKRVAETFTRQMMKFQLPSPYHTQSKDIEFSIKPYLELLRLIQDMGSISKTEIALFFLQLTNTNKYEEIINKIHLFKKERKQFIGSYKNYVSICFEKEISEIYSREISKGKLKTRESSDDSYKKFIATKRSNMLDYADAFIRHIRATELVTYDSKTLRLIISSHRLDEVLFILENTERTPKKFKNKIEFKEYLFNPYSIKLLLDDKKLLLDKIKKLDSNTKVSITTHIDDLRNEYERIYHKIKEETLTTNYKNLKNYDNFPDIINVFTQIKNKEINDPSLFLEWNVWRSFAMLNHGKRIEGNFILDLEGMPLSTAPGNRADIEIELEEFAIIGEVTMSLGQTQSKMEQDSVPRHLGNFKRTVNKDTYCVFIAPSISSGSKAFFYSLNQIYVEEYGGKTKIIPMTLDQFIIFFKEGVDNKFSKPQILQSWLENLWQYGHNSKSENDWFNNIEISINNWTGFN